LAAMAERPAEAGPGRLVVRRTFLDIVTPEDEQPGLPRAHTDSALCPGCAGDASLAGYWPGTPSTAPSAGGEDARETEDSAAPDAVASQFPTHRQDRRTTLMMSNLPNDYTRDMLVQMLDKEGFAGCYDFVYLPMDFERGCGLGYAFVNMVDASFVAMFKRCFDAYSNWGLRTSKVCRVTWSDRDQGLKANIRRYRNSPVMHPSVADEFKPCVFSDGVRAPFPSPKRGLRKPTKRA